MISRKFDLYQTPAISIVNTSPLDGHQGTSLHKARHRGILGRRDSSGRRHTPPPARFARRSCLQRDEKDDDYECEYGNILNKEIGNLTRSKSSSKEVVVGRVPTNCRNLQFLGLQIFLLLHCQDPCAESSKLFCQE